MLQVDRRERGECPRCGETVETEIEEPSLVTGARITYEQLKGGKAWFDADSLAQEISR